MELLIPQLQFLDDEGAQAELWGLSRIFLETLIEETGGQVGLSCVRVMLRILKLTWSWLQTLLACKELLYPHVHIYELCMYFSAYVHA